MDCRDCSDSDACRRFNQTVEVQLQEDSFVFDYQHDTIRLVFSFVQPQLFALVVHVSLADGYGGEFVDDGLCERNRKKHFFVVKIF